jgi:flagellar biosynthesis chaperone FliJ
MLQDAKAEIMRQIKSICGYDVKEEELSPALRESILSIAQTYKQLTVIRELLLVERKDAQRPTARLKRVITGEQDRELTVYLDQLNKLHKLLEEQVSEVTKQVVKELGSKFTPGGIIGTTASHVVIKQLKCSNCGAELKMSPGYVMKCEYCGTTYELSDYLDRLGNLIQGKETSANSNTTEGVDEQLTDRTDHGKTE